MKTISEKINFIQSVLDDNKVQYIIPKVLMGDADDEDIYSIEIIILNYHHEVVAILDTRIKDYTFVFRRNIIDDYCSETFIKTIFNIEDELNTKGNE